MILRISSLARGSNVKSILDKSVMKVKELIAELQKQDPEKDVIMFDGPSYYTPSKVYEWTSKGSFFGKVVID